MAKVLAAQRNINLKLSSSNSVLPVQAYGPGIRSRHTIQAYDPGILVCISLQQLFGRLRDFPSQIMRLLQHLFSAPSQDVAYQPTAVKEWDSPFESILLIIPPLTFIINQDDPRVFQHRSRSVGIAEHSPFATFTCERGLRIVAERYIKIIPRGEYLG